VGPHSTHREQDRRTPIAACKTTIVQSTECGQGLKKKRETGYFVGDGSFVAVNFSPVPRDKQHGRRQEAYSTINVPVMFA
jgi:hypothetical protein